MFNLHANPGGTIYAIPYRARRKRAPRELPDGVLVGIATGEERHEVVKAPPAYLESPGKPGHFVQLTGVYSLDNGEVVAIYGAQDPGSFYMNDWQSKTKYATRKVIWTYRKRFMPDWPRIKASTIQAARLALDPTWDPPEPLSQNHPLHGQAERDEDLINSAIKFRSIIEAENLDFANAMTAESFMLIVQRETAELLDD
jgi:hypothetical protein